MVRNDATFEALKQADDPAKIPPSWEKPLAEFKKVREKHLMYE
jgi:hypothetical protein